MALGSLALYYQSYVSYYLRFTHPPPYEMYLSRPVRTLQDPSGPVSGSS